MRILVVDNHPEFTAVVTDSFLSSHEVVIVRSSRSRWSTTTSMTATEPTSCGVRASGNRLPVGAVSARDEGNEALVAASGIQAAIASVV